jgi:hypothetical protein
MFVEDFRLQANVFVLEEEASIISQIDLLLSVFVTILPSWFILPTAADPA